MSDVAGAHGGADVDGAEDASGAGSTPVTPPLAHGRPVVQLGAGTSTAELHALSTSELLVHHVPSTPAGTVVEPPASGLGGLALAAGIAGLLVACFVGWGFPIGIVAVIAGIVALRRPQERRSLAVWALALGGVSLLYSAGWLVFAMTSGR